MHRPWLLLILIATAFTSLHAAPEISVQRWEGEELTSTGGVEPMSYRGTGSVQLPWINLDAVTCAPGQVRPITFTVKNSGDEPLTGLGAAVSGADRAEFVVSHALPDSLAPGVTAPLVVSFAPNVKGSMAAMLTISSNDADESAFTISLLATSQVNGPVLRVKEVGVGEVRRISSFGVVTSPVPAASEVANGATLVLTNDGDADLVNLQAQSMTGASASLPFTSLAPGASMVVRVFSQSVSSSRLVFTVNSGDVRFEIGVKSGWIIGPGPGVIIGHGPGLIIGSGPIITPINTSITNVGNFQTNIFNPPIQVLPNPNASGPVNFAFSWRFGESDAGAQEGGVLTVTKLDAFSASGTITVNVQQTVTGSPTYLDVAGTPAATKVQSKLGTHFDGTGKITSSLTLGLPDNFAVEAWARPQTTTGTQALVYCGTSGTNGFGIYLVDGVLRGRLGGAGDVGEASFTAGEWVHVALVRKAGVATFYVNGQAAGAIVTTPYVVASGGAITAGGTPAGTDLFTGDLDEVRWSQIGTGFDPAKHLLYFQDGPQLHVSVDHQSNPAITGPVNFGALYANSSLERVIYVTNQSFATVPALSATILDDAAGDFELRDPLNPIELRPYVSASVRIRYSPKGLGTRSAKVRISSGNQGETPIDVALTAEGVLPPEIEIVDIAGAPLPNGSGALPFGPAPTQQTITIKNTGAGPLLNLSAYLDGSGYAFTLSDVPASLAPGASTTLTISHTAADASLHQATLRIRSSDVDEDYYSISLTGQGQPKLVVEGLNNVPLEQRLEVLGLTRSRRACLVLRNAGGSDLKQVNIGFTGAHAAEYSVVAAPPTVIAAGQSTTVEVAFAPQGDGIRTAVFHVTSSDVTLPSFDVALAGRGDISLLTIKAAGQATTLEGGQVLALPAAAVGKTSSLTFEVTTATAPLPTLALALEGSAAADFTVALVSRTTTKATYRATFKPTASGARSATLRMKSGTPAITVMELTIAGWGLTKPEVPAMSQSLMLRLGDTYQFYPLPVQMSINAGSLIPAWPPLPVYPPDNTYQWRKNGLPIKGATTDSIEIVASSLSVAGTYSLAVTNAAGTTVKDVLLLGVFDPVVQGVELAGVGRPYTLSVRATGPDLKYQWFSEAGPVIGETKATMMIMSLEAKQVGYYCRISCGGAEVVSDSFDVAFVRAPEVTGFAENPVMRAHVLGAIPMAVNGVVTSYGGANLPPGLVVDPVYGYVYGRPTTPGTYAVQLWVSNPGGKSSTVTVPLTVLALPPKLVGHFVGSAPRSADKNEELGGLLKLTVTSTAAFTGRLSNGRQSWPFAGRFSYFNNGLVFADLPLGKKGDPAFALLDIIVSEKDGVWVMCRPTQGRFIWATAAPCLSETSDVAGRYNAGIVTDDLQRGITTPIPEGRGFVSLVVEANGLATASGRLADGVAFTSSSGLTDLGVPLFAPLYGTDGSVMARLDVGNDECGGSVSWRKEARPDDASFTEGWNTLYAQAKGSRYRAPGSGQRLLGAPVRTPNGLLVFTEGGLPDPATMPLTLSQSAVRPAPLTTSPKSFSMSINAATGHFSGSCLLGTPAQSTSFHGLIVPSANEGIGQFVRGPQKVSGDISLR